MHGVAAGHRDRGAATIVMDAHRPAISVPHGPTQAIFPDTVNPPEREYAYSLAGITKPLAADHCIV
jgi:hypothetical protein